MNWWTYTLLSGFPGSSAGKESACNAGDSGWIPGLGRRDRLPTPVFLGFPGGSDSKESTCNAEDLSFIPGLGRSPEGQHGNPLEYSCLGNCHGQWSWTSCSPWSCKELDMTEQLSTAQHTLSPIVYGFSLDLIHSMSFGKCIITCTYHFSVKHSHFTALKILCTLPICLSLKWSRTPQSLATVSSASFSSVEKLAKE